jgi:hypothetical protein
VQYTRREKATRGLAGLIQMGLGCHWSQPEALVEERASFLGPANRSSEVPRCEMYHSYSADLGCLRAQFMTPTKVLYSTGRWLILLLSARD